MARSRAARRRVGAAGQPEPSRRSSATDNRISVVGEDADRRLSGVGRIGRPAASPRRMAAAIGQQAQRAGLQASEQQMGRDQPSPTRSRALQTERSAPADQAIGEEQAVHDAARTVVAEGSEGGRKCPYAGLPAEIVDHERLRRASIASPETDLGRRSRRRRAEKNTSGSGVIAE